MADTLSVSQLTGFAPNGDVDGDGIASAGDTLRTTVTITNNSTTTAAANVALSEALTNQTFVNGQVDVSPLAFDDSYVTPGNTELVVGESAPSTPAKTVSGNFLSNDTEFLGDTFQLQSVNGNAFTSGTPLTFATTHGSVTINGTGDGSFTYLPTAGFTGTDTFTYTITDGGLDHNFATTTDNLTGTATVTITVHAPRVWYVNAGAMTDGDGTSLHPYNTLVHFSNSGVGNNVDGAGDTIFLETSATHYTGGLTLETNEQLIGASNGLVVNDGTGAVTLAAASGAANPIVDGGVVLATGNNIQGIDFGSTATAGGYSLSGSSVGTATVDTVTQGTINNGAGGGLSIAGTGNTLSMHFSSVTSTGSLNSGIALSSSSGTVTVDGGTISNSGLADISLTGSSVNFTDSGSISDATGSVV